MSTCLADPKFLVGVGSFGRAAKPFAIETLIEAAKETRRRARAVRVLTEEKRSLARELRQLAHANKAQPVFLAEQVDLVALAHELRKPPRTSGGLGQLRRCFVPK